jgi:hypothetical protein
MDPGVGMWLPTLRIGTLSEMILKLVRGDKDVDQGFVYVWEKDVRKGRVRWTSSEVSGVQEATSNS